MHLQFYSMLASPSSLTLEVRSFLLNIVFRMGRCQSGELCCLMTALVSSSLLIYRKSHCCHPGVCIWIFSAKVFKPIALSLATLSAVGLSDGQGPVRQAVLYMDRSCSFFYSSGSMN